MPRVPASENAQVLAYQWGVLRFIALKQAYNVDFCNRNIHHGHLYQPMIGE
jgi:hypothetical protein